MDSDDREQIRAQLTRIYRAAVDATNPAHLIDHYFDYNRADFDSALDNAKSVYLLAVGKAAPGMASAIIPRIRDRLTAATVVSLDIPSELFNDARVKICKSSHPLPSEKSREAATAALAMLSRATPRDLVIVALSGGASAMLSMPPEGVPLADKITLTQGLLRAGATIRELNSVRKHLSQVKGGRIARAANGARVVTLILSDVPGNDLATIGSGLTAPDPSTFGDAISVLKRRGLWGRAPETIRDYLERGNSGEILESPKPGDPVFTRVTNAIIGDNETALAAAETSASQPGFTVRRIGDLRGEANEVGKTIAARISKIDSPKICAIAGGEPVVTVRGGGKGGRAQQAALATALELANLGCARRVASLFAGTDGIDGPTDAAGAFVFTDTIERAASRGVDPNAALSRNDAYNFFARLDDLCVTGATGTNVADIFIALVNY